MGFQPVSKQPSASPVVCKIGLFKILMGPPELSTWRGRNRRNPKFTSYSLSDRKTGIRIPPSMNNFIHSWYFPSSTKAVSFAGCCFVYFSKQYPLATRPPFFLMHFQRDLSPDHTHTRQVSSILIPPLEEITRASIPEPFPKWFCSSDFSDSNALFLIHYRNLSQYVSICFSSCLFSL